MCVGNLLSVNQYERGKHEWQKYLQKGFIDKNIGIGFKENAQAAQ